MVSFQGSQEEISQRAYILHQVDTYLNMPNVEIQHELQINAWAPVARFYADQEKTNRIPLICQLARQHLAAPISSVYSERLFSEMGQVYEQRRSRLRPDNAECLLFLHHNMVRFEQYVNEEAEAVQAENSNKRFDYDRYDQVVPIIDRQVREKMADQFVDDSEYLGIYEDDE